MLKAELHTHAREDPNESQNITFTAKDLVDIAKKKGYDVLSFTFHDHLYYDEIKEYAKKKGILLIPGIEKTIEGKHVLLYNFTQKELKKINSFEDLRKEKKNKHLVVAPHPFAPLSSALNDQFYKNADLFDAIEFSSVYCRIYNINKKVERIAKKYGIPMLGNSDLHFMFQFGMTYSLIDSKKTIGSVIKAIKDGKVKVKSKMLSLSSFIKLICKFR